VTTWTKTPFGNIERMYGSLDYTGKVVLDIGADYGTTARYFLERGAERVIVSEKNPEWIAMLEEYAESEPRLSVISSLGEGDPTELLAFYRPDIVKVDCEGCERLFLNVSDAVLAIPSAWVMETHTGDLYSAFVFRFLKTAYMVRLIDYHPVDPNRPQRVIKVLTATRTEEN
jgi:hypothetical protein